MREAQALADPDSRRPEPGQHVPGAVEEGDGEAGRVAGGRHRHPSKCPGPDVLAEPRDGERVSEELAERGWLPAGALAGTDEHPYYYVRRGDGVLVLAPEQ